MLDLPKLQLPEETVEITQEEKDKIYKKIAEGYFNPPSEDEFKWSVQQDRLLYGLKNSGLSKTRQEAIRTVLHKLGEIDGILSIEKQIIENTVHNNMSELSPPTKTQLLAKIIVNYLPKDKYVDRLIQSLVGKPSPTWTEFKKYFASQRVARQMMILNQILQDKINAASTETAKLNIIAEVKSLLG